MSADANAPTSPADEGTTSAARNVERAKTPEETAEGESAGPVGPATGDAARPTEASLTTSIAGKEEPNTPTAESAEAPDEQAADVTPSAPASAAEAPDDQAADVPSSAHVPTGDTPPPPENAPQVEVSGASRFSGDLEVLTLDEVADRMGLPSESHLAREEGDDAPKRKKKKRHRKRRHSSDEEDAEPPDMPITEGSLPHVDDAASTVTRQTMPYDTDREHDPEEEKVDKSYVSLPPEEQRPRQQELMKAILRSREDAYPAESRKGNASSSGARPAAATTRTAVPKAPATVRGSVAASIPRERGAVKANPPMPPPARRVTVAEQAEPSHPKRIPPTPPRPKRHMPPPEPKNSPPEPKQRAIANAEAHLASVMANPGSTRTAKRKARRNLREAKGEPPPK